MLKVKADEYLEGLVQKAYEDGYKAGLKSARTERTKELKKLEESLAAIQIRCADIAYDLNDLAGPHGSYEM